MIIFPFFESRARLKTDLEKNENDIKKLAVLRSKYQAGKRDSINLERALATRKKGFTLFSHLEKAAGDAKVKDRIKYMKPSTSRSSGEFKESMVEMKLEGITLEELTGYLYRIEEPEQFIAVKRISVTDNKKEAGYLDSILQVMTFQ